VSISTRPSPGFLGPSLGFQGGGSLTRKFLTDGYISNSFTPLLAEALLYSLYKADPKTITAYKVRSGAYLVFITPPCYSPPSFTVQGQPAWILDYAARSGGTVVPQQLWYPQGQGDWRRYVEQADFSMPVFFINADGTLGVPVVNTVAGLMSLQGGNRPAPLGNKTTTKIRISWPGYSPSESQVQLRDQTPSWNPVTLERFVRHLGSRVRQYLMDCEYIPAPGQGLHKWTVGYGRITLNEVMLIGVVQVSAGSWIPILQLMNRVVV